MAEDPKLPWQIEKEKEEARLAAQAQFDPKLHGVGTMPVEEPQHTAALYKWAKGAFQDVEEKFAAMHKRLSTLENKPVPAPAKADQLKPGEGGQGEGPVQ
jgi:hypothetical protein